MAAQPGLPKDMVREFVIAAHFNLDKVRTMLTGQPELLTAVWEWGPDDLEDGLGAASHVGNRSIVEFFLAQGAPLTICAAAMLGRRDTVASFLQADPGQASARGAHKIPLLYHAAMSGDTSIADLLMAHGGGEGLSFVLHGAITHGQSEMARWLLEHGASDLQVRNYEDKTPLQKALELGHGEIADLLRARGATE